MLPRSNSQDNVKQPPVLNANDKPSFLVTEDYLKPIRFETAQDVHKLLVYLLHTGKIKITEDGRINVPNFQDLTKEFVVDVKGETYLYGMMCELMNNNTTVSVEVEIQQEPGSPPKLGGQIVKTVLPNFGTTFDVNIQLRNINGMPIPFLNYPENLNYLTYNGVLASMIEHLNPNPFGLLNVIAPNVNGENILLLTNFDPALVKELKNDLSCENLNLAVCYLIQLGHRQKEARRSIPEPETLNHKLRKMKEELLQRITNDEAYILSLQQRLADQLAQVHVPDQYAQERMAELLAQVQALQPAYNKCIRKHPQYAEPRPLADIQAKNNKVIQKYQDYKFEVQMRLLSVVFVITSVFLVELVAGPYLYRMIHYKKRLKPYDTINRYREAKDQAAAIQNNLNDAAIKDQESFANAVKLTQDTLESAQVSSAANKVSILKVVEVIDAILSQHVVCAGAPVNNNASVTTQTIFHRVSAMPQPATNALQIPNKEGSPRP